MSHKSIEKSGVLYLVATPIGNLGDITLRAVEILKTVDMIACEDTRHSRPLFDQYGISRPLHALHEHNEDRVSARIVEQLLAGASIALISDAGTPLINDPGFPLVRLARDAGLRIVPVPGPCALIAALSASGLPAHRFAFEGFPPRKTGARKNFFESLQQETRTLVFYESSHRIADCIRDMAQVLPPSRRLVIARELTKRYETIAETTLDQASGLLAENDEMQLGEFVLILEGSLPQGGGGQLDPEAIRIMTILMEECSLKSAVALTARITGARREMLYQQALEMSQTVD